MTEKEIHAANGNTKFEIWLRDKIDDLDDKIEKYENIDYKSQAVELLKARRDELENVRENYYLFKKNHSEEVTSK